MDKETKNALLIGGGLLALVYLMKKKSATAAALPTTPLLTAPTCANAGCTVLCSPAWTCNASANTCCGYSSSTCGSSWCFNL